MKKLLFFLISSSLSAAPLTVYLKNGTTGKSGVASEVSLIRLKEGMEKIETVQSAKRKVVFQKFPNETSWPFMVQAKYQGVLYSKTIPPVNLPSEINLVVYERSSKILPKLKTAQIYSVLYTKGLLNFTYMIHFQNPTVYTYTSAEDAGIFVHLPEEAKNIKAAVTVGSGKSQIQWLKLGIEKRESSLYFLPHAVKPGSKIFQIQYEIEYNGNRKEIPFYLDYAGKRGLQVMPQPKEMIRAVKEMPDLKVQPVYEKSLDADLIQIQGKGYKKLTLIFEGGTPIAKPQSSQGNQQFEVIYQAPLTLAQKFVAVIVFMLFFLVLFWLFYVKKVPVPFLQTYRFYKQKQLLQAEAQLKLLQESENKNPKLEEHLKKKIEKLKNQVT